jgi:hypothetical protein
VADGALLRTAKGHTESVILSRWEDAGLGIVGWDGEAVARAVTCEKFVDEQTGDLERVMSGRHAGFSWLTVWAQEGDEAGMWVMSADGEKEHHLACSCSNQAWSPDGRWLACTSTLPGYEACLVEAGTLEPHRLDLPSDARLIDWIQP